MKIFLILMIPFFLSFTSGCISSHDAQSVHEVTYVTESENPAEYGDNFDWQKKSPIDFLTMLKKRAPSDSYPVVGIHINWIKKSDVPELIKLLDSPEPCASVTRVISSYAELNGSTIGDEAAFLILGFKNGEYPPGLNSTRPRFSLKDKEELRKWWKETTSRLNSNGL